MPDVIGGPTTPLGLAAAFTPPGKHVLQRQEPMPIRAQDMQPGSLDDKLHAGSLASMETAVKRPAQQHSRNSEWPETEECRWMSKANMPATVPSVQPWVVSNKASASKGPSNVSAMGPSAPQAVQPVAQAADQQHDQRTADTQLHLLPSEQAGASLEGIAGVGMEQVGRQELTGVSGSSQACQAGDIATGAQLSETRPALRKPVIRPRVRKILFNSSGAEGQETGAGEALCQPAQLTAADQRAKMQSNKEEDHPCTGVLNMGASMTTTGAGSSLADTTAKPIMKRAVQSVFSFL